MALFNPLSNAFGLDIGDRTFKAAQVSRLSDKSPFKLRAWGSVNVPEGVMENGDVLDIKAGALVIEKLVSQTKGGLRGRAAVACLPEARCFVKLVELDKSISDTDLRKSVMQEIEMSIPLPLEEIYFDWQKIEPHAPVPKSIAIVTKKKAPMNVAPTDADETAEQLEEDDAAIAAEPNEPSVTNDVAEEATASPASAETTRPTERADVTRILLAAAPRKMVDDYTAMLEMGGLAPIAFEIESMAIARAIVPQDEPFDEPLGILDIGATRSSLIVCDAGSIQMSISIPLSGNEITDIIAKQLSLSRNDAETVKVECGLDAHRCEDRMWKILLPLIDDMSSKIRNALRFYKIGFPDGHKIERLWLCGGGAHFRDISSVMSRKLTIKVRLADAGINLQLPRSFPSSGHLTYTTAIGLALRAATESAQYRRSFRI